MPGPSDPGAGIPIDPLFARIYAGVLLAAAVVAFAVAAFLILKGPCP